MGRTRTPAKMNTRRKVTGLKAQKAQKAYTKLLKRVQKEGETRWLKNTLAQTRERLCKFGIKIED